MSLLLISPPLGSRRIVEHHTDQQSQLIELPGHGHVDVVERVPVRLEGPLPDSEEDDVADHEGVLGVAGQLVLSGVSDLRNITVRAELLNVL